jgi:hypothetical protein
MTAAVLCGTIIGMFVVPLTLAAVVWRLIEGPSPPKLPSLAAVHAVPLDSLPPLCLSDRYGKAEIVTQLSAEPTRFETACRPYELFYSTRISYPAWIGGASVGDEAEPGGPDRIDRMSSVVCWYGNSGDATKGHGLICDLLAKVPCRASLNTFYPGTPEMVQRRMGIVRAWLDDCPDEAQHRYNRDVPLLWPTPRSLRHAS